MEKEAPRKRDLGVKIEAKFDVAEYKILILSATDSSGLETWLKDNHYKIPDGAEPLLRPYVESGSKFFVAKVDPSKVVMEDGHTALSPLRFHYDSEDFSLPIRLGMANSAGKQDLIVNIISKTKRYEVANYKNVFIPTSPSSTRRCSTRRSKRTRAPSSPSTRGPRCRTITATRAPMAT